MYILSWKRHIKFSIMHKVSYVLPKIFSQDTLETFFAKNILLELERINYPSMTLIMPTLPIATGKVRDKNLESKRTSSMSEKIQTKQSLLFSKVSSSH